MAFQAFQTTLASQLAQLRPSSIRKAMLESNAEAIQQCVGSEHALISAWLPAFVSLLESLHIDDCKMPVTGRMREFNEPLLSAA